jgi:hypothetical protein
VDCAEIVPRQSADHMDVRGDRFRRRFVNQHSDPLREPSIERSRRNASGLSRVRRIRRDGH